MICLDKARSDIIKWSGGLISLRDSADTGSARPSTLSEVLSVSDSGFIYALTDPRIDDPFAAIRYIGMTTKPLGLRLTEHLTDARRNKAVFHRLSWIRSLVADGVRPEIIALESVPRSQLAMREIEIIAEYRERGALLVNSTAGGEGLLNPSDETRAKIRLSKMGHTYNVGHVVSAETREKIRQSNTGHRATAATRAKISEAGRGLAKHLGHTHTAETKERIRQKKLGVPHVWSPEARAKLSRTRLAMAQSRREDQQGRLF